MTTALELIFISVSLNLIQLVLLENRWLVVSNWFSSHSFYLFISYFCHPGMLLGGKNGCHIVWFAWPVISLCLVELAFVIVALWTDIKVSFLFLSLSLQAEGEDNLKKMQLMELAILNGTYRDNNIKTRKGAAVKRRAHSSTFHQFGTITWLIF